MSPRFIKATLTLYPGDWAKILFSPCSRGKYIFYSRLTPLPPPPPIPSPRDRSQSPPPKMQQLLILPRSLRPCSTEQGSGWYALYTTVYRGSISKLFWSPGIDSASLCSLAGRYDNPIPTRFLALIDCSKIPALKRQDWSPISKYFTGGLASTR